MTTEPTTEPIATFDVRLADGTRTICATAGDPAGNPVVFLHGLSDSWWSFQPVLERAPTGVRAVAVTLRGHGDGDRPAEGYRPEEMAGDVVTVLDQMGIGRAVIVGHSLGAGVAARLAVGRPDRVAGLVLTGAFADPAGNPDVAGLAEVLAALVDPVDPAFVAEFQGSTVARPVPERFMEGVIAESSKVPARVWRSAVAGFLAQDHLAGLDTLDVPVLLAWGDQDGFVTRADQDRLLGQFGRARLEVFEGTGHCPHWEETDRFVALLAAFVATCGEAVQ